MKVVHLMVLDKFIPPFIKFINDHFNPGEHLFIIFDKPKTDYGMDIKVKNVFWVDSKWKIFDLLKFLYSANKIIIHGLWVEKLNQLLFIQPWLLKKCYWVMWGGDFYFPQKQSIFKKFVIKNIGYLITYMPKQIEYVREHYKAKGQYIDCLFYPDGIYQKKLTELLKNSGIRTNLAEKKIRILVGNSATETNRHEIVFYKVKQYIDTRDIPLSSIEIIVPLSYGDIYYREKILKIGFELFGDSFNPLINFLKYEEYLKILLTIDIAIFYHNRQQGLGNLIQLLGMGKKVYLNKETPQWSLFESLGVRVFDFDTEFNLEIEEIPENSKIIEKEFTVQKVIEGWKRILE